MKRIGLLVLVGVWAVLGGEAGYRFGEDHVDLALPALPDHAKKILALAGGGTGDTLIREDIRHRPVGICHDLFRVVVSLVLILAHSCSYFFIDSLCSSVCKPFYMPCLVSLLNAWLV